MQLILTAAVLALLTYAAWSDRRQLAAAVEDDWALLEKELGL